GEVAEHAVVLDDVAETGEARLQRPYRRPLTPASQPAARRGGGHRRARRVRCAGGRACAGEAEVAGGRRVDNAARGQAVGALEVLDGALGEAAEDAVVLDGIAETGEARLQG